MSMIPGGPNAYNPPGMKKNLPGYAHGSNVGGAETGALATGGMGEGMPLYGQGPAPTNPTGTPVGGPKIGPMGYAFNQPGTAPNSWSAPNSPQYGIGPMGALQGPGMNGQQGGSYSQSNSSLQYGVPSGAKAEYDKAFAEAKAANEHRYGEGKGELTGVRDRSMSALDNLSGQEMADIEQRGKNRQSTIQQQQQSLGLGGTTVGATLATGVDRETSAEKRRAMDAVAQQRIGTDMKTTGDLTGFIERRTDEYPDLGAYAQLASQQTSQSGSTGSPAPAYGQQGVNPQTGQTGGGQRAFINNSVGYGPITPPRSPHNAAPTGVNLEYLTGAALNDPEYMKAYGNTPMTRPPQLLTQKQQYRYQ